MLKCLSWDKVLQYIQVISSLWKRVTAKRATEVFISLLENRRHCQKIYLLSSFFSAFPAATHTNGQFPLRQRDSLKLRQDLKKGFAVSSVL